MTAVTAPTAADFRARHRGGGLFTETINQRLGSYLCVPAYRRGLAPTALTLANLAIGLGTSIGVILLAAPMRRSPSARVYSLMPPRAASIGGAGSGLENVLQTSPR